MINHLRQIKTHPVNWFHIVSATETEIQFLRDNFHFHPLDLQDCINVNQRPKVDSYTTYLFLILLFPFYDRRNRKVFASEIDFFIGPDYLITVGDGKNTIVDRFFEDCLKSDVLRERYLNDSPAQLLYEVLHRLQEGIFPMLDHVSQDITVIEDQIFAGAERRMVSEILLIKSNIVNFRRVMNAHKSTIKKLISMRREGVFILAPSLAVYYDNILDRTKDIWEILENQRETINALQETNDALISFKLNDIVKILTAISVSILPATLVASIFGMNAVESMPLVQGPFGFWILLGIMGSVVTAFLYFFKKRDWL